MSYKGKYITVIIPAAGLGKRMKSKVSKQFIEIKNKPILAYTLDKFQNADFIDEIVLVLREDEITYTKENIIKKYKYTKVKNISEGGKERQNSVYNGLKKINELSDVVLIHDGARPFIKEETIKSSVDCAINNGACVVGVPVKDTIKIVNDDNVVSDTPDRSKLWSVQTPQAFKKEYIIKAYEESIENNIVCTDDSMLVERLGIKVNMIHGDYENIKITTPEDIKFAKTLL